VLEELSDAEGRLRDAISKKILLEVTLLRAIEARNAVSLDEVLQRLGQLRAAEGSAPAATAATPTPRIAPASPPAAAPAALKETPATAGPTTDGNEPGEPAPPVVGGELGTLWAALLEAVGRASPFARSYLVKAFPTAFDGKTLTIGFEPEFEEYLSLVDSTKNRTLVQTKLKELGHGDVEVRFAKAQRPPGPAAVVAPPPEPVTPATAPVPVPAPPASKAPKAPPPPPPPRARPERLDPADFKNDPLIKQALEIFRGQIVEVRG
jgi:DNA polymerase-3 subunit gamma/tau